MSKSPNPRKPVGERLTIEFFRLRSVVDPINGCWLWTGARNTSGYGAVRVGQRTTSPHRAVFQLATDVPVPSTLDICHRCDVRHCVNPDHLFVGTRADNMADCARKGRIRTPNLAGDECPASKLTSEAVLEIRHSAEPARVLAARFGVSTSAVKIARAGKVWRSVGGPIGPRPRANQAGLIRVWEPEEDAFIRANAGRGTTFLVGVLNRTDKAILTRSTILGVKVRRFMRQRGGVS